MKDHRSSHLRNVHGIETYPGVVRDNFVDSRFDGVARGYGAAVIAAKLGKMKDE